MHFCRRNDVAIMNRICGSACTICESPLSACGADGGLLGGFKFGFEVGGDFLLNDALFLGFGRCGECLGDGEDRLGHGVKPPLGIWT